MINLPSSRLTQTDVVLRQVGEDAAQGQRSDTDHPIRSGSPGIGVYSTRAEPGTCIAAWMALDPCDEENGCLEVVPGSHEWPVLCTIGADTSQSFTDVTVPLPDDSELVPVLMEPGDVLFFNGSLVHGSKPNRSDRFRRALIGATTSRATRGKSRAGTTRCFEWTAAEAAVKEPTAAERDAAQERRSLLGRAEGRF